MASWSAPPLRSAFAETAAAGAAAAEAEAADGGEDATGTARPATAARAVPVPTEAAPRRHDSAEGRARRARARAPAEATARWGGDARAARGSAEGGGAGRGLAGWSARVGGGHPRGRAAQAAPGVSRAGRGTTFPSRSRLFPRLPPPDLGRRFGKCRAGDPDARPVVVTLGSPGAEGSRPASPRGLVGRGEGHLRDRYEAARWQRRSQRGCRPCPRGAEPPPPAFSCGPPAAFGRHLERAFHGDAPAAAANWAGGGGRVRGEWEAPLLCSCCPAKPLPHSREGKLPETAALNGVEAGGFCLNISEGAFFPPLVIFQCER